VLVAALATTSKNPKPVVPKMPYTNAELYHWDMGCPKRSYFDGMDIPCGCQKPEYQIVDWEKRGLYIPRERRRRIFWKKPGSKYFRVGNNAIAIINYRDPINGNYCKVMNIELNFFDVPLQKPGKHLPYKKPNDCIYPPTSQTDRELQGTIPCGCRVGEYEIKNWEEIGLETPYSIEYEKYYRIDDDIVLVSYMPKNRDGRGHVCRPSVAARDYFRQQ
jgi:Ni/Co efflux regulator RcnB